jgi:hypothetical protein
VNRVCHIIDRHLQIGMFRNDNKPNDNAIVLLWEHYQRIVSGWCGICAAMIDVRGLRNYREQDIVDRFKDRHPLLSWICWPICHLVALLFLSVLTVGWTVRTAMRKTWTWLFPKPGNKLLSRYLTPTTVLLLLTGVFAFTTIFSVSQSMKAEDAVHTLSVKAYSATQAKDNLEAQVKDLQRALDTANKGWRSERNQREQYEKDIERWKVERERQQANKE